MNISESIDNVDVSLNLFAEFIKHFDDSVKSEEPIEHFDDVSVKSDEFIKHFDVSVKSEEPIEHFDDSVKSEESYRIKKQKDVIKKDVEINCISRKELVDKMIKKNYNEYKKKKSEVDKVYQEWVHPELNLFETFHLNKCVCKNCGKVKDINVTSKKEKSYF